MKHKFNLINVLRNALIIGFGIFLVVGVVGATTIGESINTANLNIDGGETGSAGHVQFYGGSGYTSKYTGFRGSDTPYSYTLWELPYSDGPSGYLLATNGNAELYWTGDVLWATSASYAYNAGRAESLWDWDGDTGVVTDYAGADSDLLAVMSSGSAAATAGSGYFESPASYTYVGFRAGTEHGMTPEAPLHVDDFMKFVPISDDPVTCNSYTEGAVYYSTYADTLCVCTPADGWYFKRIDSDTHTCSPFSPL